MTDFVKTYTLKQHTPLIHFQHGQDGATLRATELKPKIDAMVISQVFGVDVHGDDVESQSVINTIASKHPAWLVGGGKAQHPALDYKLRVRAEMKAQYLVASNISRTTKEELDDRGMAYLEKVPYFADNEPIKNLQMDRAKRGMMYKNITLEIVCLHPQLMDAIAAALPYVFAYHNFGVRQSKGFGCFSLENQTADEFEDLLREHALYGKALVYRFNKPVGLAQYFGKIENEYKILKSGFARDPSQMMEYFKENDIEWEKPVIKRELVQNRGIPSRKDYTKDTDYRYIRALLGVAELYEFPRDREKIKIACAENDPDGNGMLVERFRSPITFKVFDQNIYMLPEAITDKIYDKKFSFTNSRKSTIELRTPKKGDFDLLEFLENHVDKSWEYVSNK